MSWDDIGAGCGAARLLLSAYCVVHVRPDFQRASIDHVECDIEDDQEADIGDPMAFLENPGNQRSGSAHQSNREDQAEN